MELLTRFFQGYYKSRYKKRKSTCRNRPLTGLFPPSPGGGKGVAPGYKGKGVLIHLLVDTLGHPIAASTTPANGDERKEVEGLVSQLPAPQAGSKTVRVVEADKGYDAMWLRSKLINLRILPIIPYRRIPGRNIPKTSDEYNRLGLSPGRWRVERAFAWVKRRCRRLLLR